MKNPFLTASIVFLGVVSFGEPLMAQTKMSRDGRPEKMFRPLKGMTAQDLNFARAASASNLFEIQSSQLALRKTSDPFVTQFAKRMIADHQMAQDELKSVAQKKGIQLPQDLPAPLKKTLARLQTAKGKGFDRAYLVAQVEGHEKTAVAMRKEISKGRDEDVKGFAVKTLPAVKRHHQMLSDHSKGMRH